MTIPVNLVTTLKQELFNSEHSVYFSSSVCFFAEFLSSASQSPMGKCHHLMISIFHFSSDDLLRVLYGNLTLVSQDARAYFKLICLWYQLSKSQKSSVSIRVAIVGSDGPLNVTFWAHYSKSQIFVQKFNFDNPPTFSRVFHPTFFLTIFLVKSKLSTAKKSKTTTFSRVFHPNFFWQFFREIKVVNS